MMRRVVARSKEIIGRQNEISRKCHRGEMSDDAAEYGVSAKMPRHHAQSALPLVAS